MNNINLESHIADYVINNKESHYRLAYSYVKNREDALDIVQESIYKAISSKRTLKNPDHIRTWFYRIVVNTSLDFLRKQKKLVLSDDETMLLNEAACEDSYHDIDLQNALCELPDSCRSIIILRYFEDLKIDEIAEILDENVNTVKTRLYKSLEKLRIQLSEGEEE